MSSSKQALQDWYANQLKEFHGLRYRAHLAFDQTGQDPETLYPMDTQLSVPAVRADRTQLPPSVREAYEYYWKHFEEEDIGFARVYRVMAAGQETYAIRVRTDGDDGYLEVYDLEGDFLAAGRSYIEVVVWGSSQWLRDQVEHFGEFPPEVQAATQQTLWGKPVEDLPQ